MFDRGRNLAVKKRHIFDQVISDDVKLTYKMKTIFKISAIMAGRKIINYFYPTSFI